MKWLRKHTLAVSVTQTCARCRSCRDLWHRLVTSSFGDHPFDSTFLLAVDKEGEGGGAPAGGGGQCNLLWGQRGSVAALIYTWSNITGWLLLKFKTKGKNLNKWVTRHNANDETLHYDSSGLMRLFGRKTFWLVRPGEEHVWIITLMTVSFHCSGSLMAIKPCRSLSSVKCSLIPLMLLSTPVLFRRLQAY